MRWFLAAAAALAAVRVFEVLTATQVGRFAEPAAFALLAVYASLRGSPRWLGPAILSPLLLNALLTIPPATRRRTAGSSSPRVQMSTRGLTPSTRVSGRLAPCF